MACHDRGTPFSQYGFAAAHRPLIFDTTLKKMAPPPPPNQMERPRTEVRKIGASKEIVYHLMNDLVGS